MENGNNTACFVCDVHKIDISTWNKDLKFNCRKYYKAKLSGNMLTFHTKNNNTKDYSIINYHYINNFEFRKYFI